MTAEMKTRVNDILKTLPIGYYIKKNVPVILEDCPASHYDFTSQTITISTVQLDAGIEKLEDKSKIENDIRCMLYHEVSHAFASYKWEKWDTFGWSAIMNIFEDERIETIFAKKYMGVDFKGYVKRMANFEEAKAHCPKTAQEFFYNIVRFRFGPKKFVDEVQYIIDEYADVSPLCSEAHADSYETAVSNFWQEVRDYFNEHKEEMEKKYDEARDTMKDSESEEASSMDSEEGESGTSEKEGDKGEEGKGASEEEGKKDGEAPSPTKAMDGEKKDEEGKMDGASEDEKDGEGEEEVDEEGEGEEGDKDDPYKIVEGDGDPCHGRKGSEDIYEKLTSTLFEKSLTKYTDSKIQQQFETIINNAKCASVRNGSAINSYFGTFDPRSAGRDDYKFFLVKNRLGNVKQYSKLHLNLFIDNSGSYYHNDNVTNCMLACLSKIEKQNPDFSFQLVTINMEVVEHKSNDITFKSDGGNLLPKSLFDIVKKYQYKDKHVINIVLFDGDFVTDEPRWRKEEAKSHCAAFNVPNTTIITDRDNEVAFKKYCKGCKIVVTKNYAQELIQHVANAIQVGL